MSFFDALNTYCFSLLIGRFCAKAITLLLLQLSTKRRFIDQVQTDSCCPLRDTFLLKCLLNLSGGNETFP